MLPSPSWGVEYVLKGAARVGFGSAFSALLTPSSARQLAFFSADRRRAPGRGGGEPEREMDGGAYKFDLPQEEYTPTL